MRRSACGPQGRLARTGTPEWRVRSDWIRGWRGGRPDRVIPGRKIVRGYQVQLLHGLILDLDACGKCVGEQSRVDVQAGLVTAVRMELRTVWKRSSGRAARLRLMKLNSRGSIGFPLAAPRAVVGDGQGQAVRIA